MFRSLTAGLRYPGAFTIRTATLSKPLNPREREILANTLTYPSPQAPNRLQEPNPHRYVNLSRKYQTISKSLTLTIH